MEKLIAHIRLLRPLNLSIDAFSIFIGAAIAGELRQTTVITLAMLVVVCYNAGANAINDYFDYKIDKINRPQRPLVTGLVGLSTAKWLGVLLFITGTILAFQLNWGARFLAIAGALPLMVFYTQILKGLPLIGNIAVAMILGLAFLFAGAAVGNPGPLLVPAALAFSLTLVRELIKDIADMDGDRQANLTTFPLLVGEAAAIMTAINLSFLVAAGVFFPFITGYYGWKYLLLAGIGVVLPLFYIIYLLIKDHSTDAAAVAARILKFATIMGVIAVYLG